MSEPHYSDPMLSPKARTDLEHAAAESKHERQVAHESHRAHPVATQPAIEHPSQPVAAPSVPHRKRPSVADMLSRTVFGGFWSLVTVGLVIMGGQHIFSGDLSGFLTWGIALLTGVYARYLFRGGRWRLLFW